MLLERRSDLQSRSDMPAGSPVVSSTTTARKGTSSSPKWGEERAEIKPTFIVRGWAPKYLAEVRPEKKSFRLWKCPECDAIRTNGEISSTAASSG